MSTLPVDTTLVKPSVEVISKTPQSQGGDGLGSGAEHVEMVGEFLQPLVFFY